jgi:integrase
MNGVEKLLTLGKYPDVSLKRAREKRDDARKLVADNVDPSVKRQAERHAQADTFGAIATEWLNLNKATWADETISILEGRVKAYLLPYLGSRPIAAITAQELLGVLRRVEARGRNETAHRVRLLAGRILRFAVATGRASHDVAADLKDALAPVASRNFASVTDPVKVGELLRAIDGYSGQPITALTLKLAPLVFVRPGGLRGAEWSEFDFENSQWRIPGPRMKMGDPHIVPLSRQAVEILKELERFTGTGSTCFRRCCRWIGRCPRTRSTPRFGGWATAATVRATYHSRNLFFPFGWIRRAARAVPGRPIDLVGVRSRIGLGSSHLRNR